MPTSASTAALLRSLPKVDRLLAAPEMEPILAAHSRAEVVQAIRGVLDELRRAAGQLNEAEVGAGAVCARVAAALTLRSRPYYRRVINGTGVILHTGIGRAVLAPEAVAALAETAGHAQRLEIDLDSGQRGGRDEGCAALLREITGCEDATVVNNNAGATLLLLAAMARGRGVVLSRGELVEIGGSFRIPDVMSESGARLVEVGTTNRTHLSDYRGAIDSETGMILKVHTSNYRVLGFTSEVEIEELVALGRGHGLPVGHDLGSGCAVDLAAHGLTGEPLLRRSVAAGADLICFSGDKLLGGPQAGLLIGRKEAVERCRRHPLYRALRPGRLIYTALEATLRLYRGGEAVACERLPVLRQLTASQDSLMERGHRLIQQIVRGGGGTCGALRIGMGPCQSQAGSGALPVREIESWGVWVSVLFPPYPGTPTIPEIAAALRTGDPAILGRIQDGSLLFDLRTLSDDDFEPLAARLREIAGAE
jgi:L-seryl-tRNA(Ser) seleniumtransferase